MRILFSSVGAAGHIYPMVPLARALEALGNEIRWATSPDMCGLLDEAGIPAVGVGVTTADRRKERDRIAATVAGESPQAITNALAPRIFAEVVAPATLRDLLPLTREWRPALVINDQAELAAPVAASAVDAVHVTHSFGRLPAEPLVRTFGERCAHLWQQVGLEPRPYAGLYDHLFLDIYPPSLQRPDVNHVARRQPLRSVGYPPATDAGLPASLALHADRPLLYVTLGTEISDDRVLRLLLDAVADRPVRALLTVGNQRDPASFGHQPDHVTIERFVPQAAVLPHAAAVISHGGSGTFLASLAAGLPQLCIPHLADQPMNAAAITESGAGLSLELATLDRQAIDVAITRLLSDTAIAERAKAVASEIANLPSPTVVATLLEAGF
jgi:UDP:flavonoid glycosyltransferase YjiC (YdhE family)